MGSKSVRRFCAEFCLRIVVSYEDSVFSIAFKRAHEVVSPFGILFVRRST